MNMTPFIKQQQGTQYRDDVHMTICARGPLMMKASLPHYILAAGMCQFDSLSCTVSVVADVLLPA